MLLNLLVPSLLALAPHRPGDHTVHVSRTASQPNVVTPLLERGDYRTAQSQSRVHLPGWDKTELYSGFFEIDASTNSNTYFMFSTAMSGRKDAPVVLWLNGGPGASSLLGFYDELGPFVIDGSMQLEPRRVSWNRDAHLLALDNPL